MKSLIQTKNTYLILVAGFIISLFVFTSCNINPGKKEQNRAAIINLPGSIKSVLPAANQTATYLPLIKGKNIAVVANQTSVIYKDGDKEYSHLIDSLLTHGINIVRVFAPEHGFRGEADAGEKVVDEKDTKTGLSLVSLYGKNKKPSKDQLAGIDLVLFDIQDVGVRFYTYISTLTYVMEACAEQGIPLMVLDRPNPNAHYIDGPMLEPAHSSFVGMHPVPLVYGLTIGEYGKMVNGEEWLNDGIQCELNIIPVKNYSHDKSYSLAIRPSPNLPNDLSINLYPSLGFFEGTIINAGRGTEFQFQRYGAPFFPASKFHYTPQSNFGSKSPKFKGEKCFGVDLSKHTTIDKVSIEWLVDAYNKTPKNESFFGKTFTVHAGNEKLRKKIESGMTAKDIHDSWQKDIEAFKIIRSNYLIYP